MSRPALRRLLTAALVLLLVWLVGYPLVLTFLSALWRPGGWGFEAFAALFGRPDEWLALWRSLWISVLSVVTAGALGVPLGFLFARARFPGQRLLGALVTLPVALPPLVGVIAFLFLFGESGFVARGLVWLLGLEGAPWRLQGPVAILLVHTYSFYVYFFLFTRAALTRLDPSLPEAAAALGAGPGRILARVTLPLLRPALAAAALLTFLTSLASFSAPYLFGGSFRVMTTQIVASRLNGDVRMAQVEAVALAVLALTGLLVAQRLQGRSPLMAVLHGMGGRRPQGRGRGRAAAVVAWSAALVLVLPHLTLILLSLVPAGSWTVELMPPVLDLGNYRRLLSEAERLRPVLNSLWMAAAATAAALVLGFVAARRAHRAGPRVSALLAGLVTVPWAVPGTVFAVALATTFSVHQPWAGRFLLVGTPLLLPLAYLLRSLPLTGRSVMAGLRQLDPAQEEAAAALGAGGWRILVRVVVPQLAPAVAAGVSLAFIGALGDFIASIVLYTYTTRPISIEMLSSLRLQETGMAAAYGVLLMVLSTAALLAWGTGDPERSTP